MLHRIGDKNTESDGSCAQRRDPQIQTSFPPLPRRQAGRFTPKKKYNILYILSHGNNVKSFFLIIIIHPQVPFFL